MQDDLWRKLVINAPEFIAIVDQKGVLKYANWYDDHPARDQVLGSSIFDHTVSEHHDIPRKGLKQVFEKGEPASWQIQAFDESGEAVWWSTLVVPLEASDNPSEAALYGRNIRTQKKVEEDLRASERRLMEAERIGKVGHWVWDIPNDEVFWSDQVFRVLGMEPGAIVPSIEQFARFVPEEDLDVFNQIVSQIRDSSLPREHDSMIFERTVELLDGTRKRLLERGLLTRQEDGTIITLHGVIHDITDIKTIELQLENERDRLAKKNTALTEVLKSFERRIEDIKEAIRRDISSNIEPMFTRLRRRLKPAEQMYLTEIEETLSEITEPIVGRQRQPLGNLTPREIEICNWIKKGNTSREIAEILDISSQTVDKFRQKIRKKLDLTDQRINLTNFLRSETSSGESS